VFQLRPSKIAGKHQLQFGVNDEHLYFLQDREGANTFNIFPVANNCFAYSRTEFGPGTGKYDPSLPLAFSIARLFNRPIEAIFEPAYRDSGDQLLPK